MDSSLLVSTWQDGVFLLQGGKISHEVPGRQAWTLAAEENGSALAIIDQQSLWRRARDGGWTEIAKSKSLSSCLNTRGEVFVGTDDGAHLLRLAGGTLKPVESFDRTPGRDTWAAGAALIDGKWIGPPLGIRSMSASPDGAVLLVNVHVGGIPRSTDRGASWHPTINIDTDVHQVAAHPTRPGVAAAAAARGLCISRDGGMSWRIETEGLDHPYCSAVAFIGDDIYVAASDGHFVKEGGVYRRPIDSSVALKPVGGGVPRVLDGIVDTANIAVDGASAAIVDRGGNVYLSEDAGLSWARAAEIGAAPSAVVFI